MNQRFLLRSTRVVEPILKNLNMTKVVKITDSIQVGANSLPLVIAGPCQIESRDHALSTAEKLKNISIKYGVNFVYKSSFDKANRTSISGARGVGMQQGLEILAEVKSQLSIPVLTDVHAIEQIDQVAKVVDILQTPAFLCRQTDFLKAVGSSGKAVNIKKGQFLHPQDMQFAAEKIAHDGNDSIMLCERGACFGYRDLVLDPRALVIMRELGYPVIFDATHSVQSMGGAGGASGGERRFVVPLLKAALAVGVDGVFVECHQSPEKAPSDGATMLPLDQMEQVFELVVNLHSLSRAIP